MTTTISGNGLSTIVDIDRDGNGSVDNKTTTIKTNYATGAVGTVSTVYAGDSSLISRSSTYYSPDKKSTSYSLDRDGDGIIDLSIGTYTTMMERLPRQIRHLRVLAPDAMMFANVSDDGLTTAYSIDIDGNGTTDLTKTVTSTLNIDGSISTTTRNYLDTFAQRDHTTVTVSADGLSKSTLWDADGNGVINRYMSDITVLNADGSTTQTMSYFKASNAAESRTIIFTSADKLTTTTTEDINGNGVVDYKSVSVIGTDGIKTTTNTNFGADGVTVIGKTVISSYLDLWTSTSDLGMERFGTDIRTLQRPQQPMATWPTRQASLIAIVSSKARKSLRSGATVSISGVNGT